MNAAALLRLPLLVEQFVDLIAGQRQLDQAVGEGLYSIELAPGHLALSDRRADAAGIHERELRPHLRALCVGDQVAQRRLAGRVLIGGYRRRGGADESVDQRRDASKEVGC